MNEHGASEVGRADCIAHRGAHGVYDGSCIVVGRAVQRPYRWRFSRCERCGAELDIRISTRTDAAEPLTAGTDTPHWHEAPLTVRLDAEELAGAIVQASRAARQERQTSQTPAQTNQQTTARATMRRAVDEARGVLGVQVVRPDGGQ